MKSFHFLFTTLILAIYTCLVWVISPVAPTTSISPKKECTECTYKLSSQDRMPVHNIKEVQGINLQLRTRLEQQRFFIDTNVLLLIKNTVNKVSSFYTQAIKQSILSSRHQTDYPTAPPCQYYVFALRQILA